MSLGESRFKKFEDYGYVLDYLPNGKPISSRGFYRAEPIIQLVGEAYYTLLEATTRNGVDVNHDERIYVGKDRIRAKVSHIIGRISYGELTVTAKSELPIVLVEIVAKNEERYVYFFNNAQPVTPRMHSLELIPGIGKKFTRMILEMRDRLSFSSFKDLKDRIQISDPVKLVAKRVLKELSEDPKYWIFTRPP